MEEEKHKAKEVAARRPLVAYIRGHYWMSVVRKYSKLRPTGEWKLESGPYGVDVMYVQHQGAILKTWIHEDNIEFLPDEETTIFNCKENK